MNDLPAPLAALRNWVKAQPDDAAELRLNRVEAKELLDHFMRLHQSNRMLRKQNRKVRVRATRPDGDAAPDAGE